MLGVQTVAAVVIIIWSVVTSFIVLKLIDLTIGLRLTLEQELYGADYCEHNVEVPPEVKEYAEAVLKKLKEQTEQARNNSEDAPKKELENPIKQRELAPVNEEGELFVEDLIKTSDDETVDNEDQANTCDENRNNRHVLVVNRKREKKTEGGGVCNPAFQD